MSRLFVLLVVPTALALSGEQGGAAATAPVRVVVQPAPTGGVDLKQLVTAAADRALAQLPHHGQVVIDVRPDVTQVIPQIGIGGYTDQRGNLHLSWDPGHAGLRHSLLTWIPPDVAHELDHSSRIRDGAGYGPTLGDQIVAEGLADRFAYQVFPNAPPQPWDHALTKTQERAYWKTVKPWLDQRDLNRFFWGGPSGAFPKWAGYTLGFDIVGRYLAAHHLTGRQAVLVDAATILGAFHGV